ncbi:MAG: putative Multi-sensor signal transduction histidine kinase [Candidatus Saccharibacteria bacterium]|nr:putative Multi-sensor signal transduction histidine kinase [Candidatus Saccharibacteria bacterium]
MFEGGISFNKDSDRALRLIGLLGTPIFVGYNLLVFFGIAHSPNYSGNLTCLVISALWLAAGAYHFFAPIRSMAQMLFRIVMYHIITIATLMFITGFIEPFTSSVVLLFLAYNVYFGRKALLLSIASFIVAAVIDIIIRYPSDHTIVANNLIGIAAITVLGVALVGIIMAQETRRQTLIHSQIQERLQYDRVLTIINNLSDATFSTDEKGNVLMYNAACLNLLDTNDNLKGANISSLFKLTGADKKSVQLFDILSEARKTVRRDDISHTYDDGEEIRLEMTYAPIKSTYSRRKKGQVQGGFILIVRDVTKQKSLEEERDEFISVVSHELRTPITIVEGTLSNLQVMMDMPTKPEESVLKGSIGTAHDQVLYLAKMVNDLSTLSRAERGVADAGEDINVEELMHKLHKEYEKAATARKLHLNLDLGTKLGTIHVSRLYVEELLQNFITNAIKYTNEGSITVTAKAKKGVILFSVKDSGIGISRGDQQKIFAKFYRSEDYRIRETNGTGLGLYVSAKLAHKIGTQINVSSRLNHGSTFSFELPQVTK